MNIDFRPMQAHPIGAPRPNYPANRATSSWHWPALLSVLALPFLYAGFIVLRAFLDVSAPGYLSLSTVEIKSQTAGIVAGVFAYPGEDVQAGTPLFTVSDPHVTARIESLREELEALRAVQRVPPPPPHDTENPAVVHAEAAVRTEIQASANERLEEARKLLAQTRDLIASGAATDADARDAQERVKAAQNAYLQAQLEATKASLATIRTPQAEAAAPSPYEELAVTNELRTLERTTSLGTQRAPFAGRVVAIQTAPGASVAAEQTLMLVEGTRPPRVLAYLDPADAGLATIGHAARVEFPGHGFEQAHVCALSGVIESRGTIEATLLLDKPLRTDEHLENFPVYVHFQRFSFSLNVYGRKPAFAGKKSTGNR